MNFISDYYEQLLTCDRVMVILNSEEDLQFTSNLISNLNIKELIVASEYKKYLHKIKNKIEDIQNKKNIKITTVKYKNDEYISVDDNKKLNSDCNIDAIIFNKDLNNKQILSLQEFAPKILLGKLYFNEVDYYDVWSKFRNFSTGIFLEVIMPNGKIERVEWEPSDSNIEISVIFPVYNVEKYLDKCIETVTEWNADYIEFIFVNDGSPDNSAQKLKKISEVDSRIKVIDKENGGCASARKLGLENAKGKYVGFIDPDDFIEPDMFKQLHKRALLGSYQVCYSGYNEYYENTKNIKRVTNDAIHWPYTEGVRDEREIKKLIMCLRVAIWRGIYLKSMLDENNITFNENLKRFDDLPFKIEVFSKAKSVVAVPEYLYYYRLERPGQDVSCSDERLYVHFDIFDYIDDKKEILQDSITRDYIQMSKLQTHLYAIQKIDNKYFKTYVKKMKKDMRKNMKPLRNLIITKAYLGKDKFVKMNMINLGLAKIIKLEQKIKFNMKKDDKNILNLKKLY
ncbi:glycosyltransferase [Romboutsia timonensis]|uniref:glycosyltransferase n=1 Tax=Romboutsia timonensis TaxID=1776391 RepID=UPI002A81E78C|nr:glycosyltransferase [Romboutsia timonensis]MDY3959848.1 glycosyltransferase [Romboutsia timonensis]